MDHPTTRAIRDRIRRGEPGVVFIARDFLDLGSRAAVDQALAREVRDGELSRIGRGLYCRGRINARLGVEIPPDADEVARALARQSGSRVAPSGAAAANRLGLSTQVSAHPVYVTDGPSRRVVAGGLTFSLRHVGPADFPQGRPMSALVIQALRYLGQEAIDSGVLRRLREVLSPTQRLDLLSDARYTSPWIAAVARQLN